MGGRRGNQLELRQPPEVVAQSVCGAEPRAKSRARGHVKIEALCVGFCVSMCVCVWACVPGTPRHGAGSQPAQPSLDQTSPARQSERSDQFQPIRLKDPVQAGTPSPGAPLSSWSWTGQLAGILRRLTNPPPPLLTTPLSLSLSLLRPFEFFFSKLKTKQKQKLKFDRPSKIL